MTKEPTLSDLLKWCADHEHSRVTRVPYSELAEAAARLEARVAELELQVSTLRELTKAWCE